MVQCLFYIYWILYTEQCTLYNIVQCIAYNIQWTVYTVHCIIYSVHCIVKNVWCGHFNYIYSIVSYLFIMSYVIDLKMYNYPNWQLYDVRLVLRVMYAIHCTTYTVRYTNILAYNVQYTTYIVRRTVYGVHRLPGSSRTEKYATSMIGIARHTMYGVQFTCLTVRYIQVSTPRRTFHVVQCTWLASTMYVPRHVEVFDYYHGYHAKSYGDNQLSLRNF